MSVVDTRNLSRDSLFLLAEVRLEGSAVEFQVKVRNLSAGGTLAEGSVPVVPGHRLKIRLRNIGWIDGGVAWVQENRFGIAFDYEIDAKLVRTSVTDTQPGDDAQRQFLRSHFAHVGRRASKPDKLRNL